MKHATGFCANKNRGFGLVELMIALALGLVIMMGVSTLFSDSSRTLFDMSKQGRTLEGGLFAMDLITTEIIHAGYWAEAGNPIAPETDIFRSGETPDVAPTGFPLPPPPCVGTESTGFTSKEELAYGMAYPIFSETGADLTPELAKGTDGSAGNCHGSGGEPRAKSEYFVIRRASTCAVGETNCPPFDDGYHLQMNACIDENNGFYGSELRLDNDQANLDYRTYLCDSSILAPIYRYVSRLYYVNQDDELIRMNMAWDGSQFEYVPEELVEGVEMMAFEWGLDNTGNGEVDAWSTAMTDTDWPNAVAVKLWLVVRNLSEEAGYTDTATYTVAGASYTVPDGNESYRRSVHNRVIELPNIAGPRR